jgi:predicted Zn finger-like uncharacterized protein
MIVTCTSCQARFRIPDEKIGSRGARVRCSKCKNVFVAKPASAGAAEEVAPPPDPFAAPPDDPFAASQAAQADPFAAAPRDPFAPPPPPPRERAGGLDLPVTDLSDLAASGRLPVPAAPGGFTALAPPVPAAPPAVEMSDAGVASADDLVLEDPSRAIPVAPPPLPPAAPAFDFGAGGELAEPAPGLAEPAAGESPGAPLFEFGTPGTDLGEPAGAEPMRGLELGPSAGGVAGGDLAGADPFAAASPGEALAPGAGGMERAAPRAHTVTEPIPREPPPPAHPTAAELRKALSAPSPRGRMQAFVANVFSLAALLAVAAGLLSWWLRDSAVPDRAAGRPAVAVDVRSGLYETAAGKPVLFVRGEVQSRSPVPLGRVVVRAEVLQGGEVVARAEGLAGAVPSPEQVAQLGNRQDAARLRAQVASRAPARLAPGESLPFLVTFDEVPEDVRDAVFRVVAEPQPGAPPRAP